MGKSIRRKYEVFWYTEKKNPSRAQNIELLCVQRTTEFMLESKTLIKL